MRGRGIEPPRRNYPPSGSRPDAVTSFATPAHFKREPMPKPKKRGPKPDRLAIPSKWKDALTKAVKKIRPPEGWPEESRKGKKRVMAGKPSP